MKRTKPSWIHDMPDTLEYHRAHPEITVAAHRESQRLSLARRVLDTHRIYLDTKFWVILGDTHRGRRSVSADIELLAVLRNLKSSGTAICPLSYSSIHELWHQADVESRRATAAVMDELSGAVCLQAPHFLFDIELRQLLYSALLPDRVIHPPRELVWTKASFYVGEPLLRCKALPGELVVTLQKCIDDSMFSATLSDLVEATANRPLPSSADLDTLAADLTSGKNNNPEVSFAELYRQEITGGLESHQEACEQIMERLCRVFGFDGGIGDTEREAGGKMLRGLVEAGVKAGKVRAEFPQLHINASLHAALRCDNRRRYKRGDCEDFRHAGSALPYFNYFLTEKSLCHLLCNKPLMLNAEYEAEVFFDSGSAVSALSQLH